MNIKRAISIVDTLREGWYTPPLTYRPGFKTEFEYRSYKCMAMKEIKMYLLDHQEENPIDSMEKYRSEMSNLACSSKTDEAKFMFSIYYDVATDVLDVLLGSK